MDCDECREALSADLDGEGDPASVTGASRHLERCGACRDWETVAARLHGWVRVRSVEPLRDRTDEILAAVPLAIRPRPVREGVRYALLAVGLTQLVLALPALLLAESTAAPIHITREMGAFEVALGIGLLASVWRPRLATGMLPFAGALAGAMLLTAAIDLFQGQTVAASEGQHVLAMTGVALLAALTRRPRADRDMRSRMSAA